MQITCRKVNSYCGKKLKFLMPTLKTIIYVGIKYLGKKPAKTTRKTQKAKKYRAETFIYKCTSKISIGVV